MNNDRLLKIIIEERLGKECGDIIDTSKYFGFDMSGEHCEDIVGRGNDSAMASRWENFLLIKKRFPEFTDGLSFKDFRLFCWKGTIWWGKPMIGYDWDWGEENMEIDFTGQTTHDIVFWILKYWENKKDGKKTS